MNNENGKRRKVGVVGYGHLGEIFFKIFVNSFCRNVEVMPCDEVPCKRVVKSWDLPFLEAGKWDFVHWDWDS